MNPEPYDEVTIVLDWTTLHSIERVEALLQFGEKLTSFFLVSAEKKWNVGHLVDYSPKKQMLNKALTTKIWEVPKRVRTSSWFGYLVGINLSDGNNSYAAAPYFHTYFAHRKWPFNRATVVLRMIAGGDLVSVFERTVGLLGGLRFGDDATVSCVLRCGTGDWMVAPDPIRSASGTISSSSSEITMALS